MFYGFLALSFLSTVQLSAQIQPGCVNANFGVDADVHANRFHFGGFSSPQGTDDWFKSASYNGSGVGVLDTAGASALYSFYTTTGNFNKIFIRRANTNFFEPVNNTIQVDAIFARDYNGSSGYEDSTAFATGSKNGMDPIDWDATFMPVQGKNDLLDVYGHLRRAGTAKTAPLWLFMGASIAAPTGTRYMDFEFFQKSLTFNNSTKFTSLGAEEGHTAFDFDNTTGKITKTGDLIFSMSVSGGAPSDFEIRIWVSRALYNSTFNPTNFDFDRSGAFFDGASNGSTYGYAKIIPKGSASLEACGIVNTTETPAGPWGTLNSSSSYTTDYSIYQFAEFGFNLSSFGIDPLAVNPLASVCTAAFASYVVKTRASASFTAALKDFGGPYVFGGPQSIAASITSSNILTCDTPSATLTATTSPASSVAFYVWTLPNGTKQSGTALTSITATQVGTYTLEIAPVEGCSIMGNATFNLTQDISIPLAPTNPQGASYCLGTPPAAISVANPAAGYEIRWYSAATGGTVLATGASYTPNGAGTFYAETRNTITGCVSSRIAVTLTQIAVLASTNTPTICPYGSITLSSTVTPTGNYGYQWQRSIDSINWTNISGATAANRTVTNIIGEVYFRLKTVANGCASYSAGVKISTFDTSPPVFSSTPTHITVSCNDILPSSTLSATDDCQLQDIVFHETYSTCNNPVLNANGGLENVSNLATDTTFYGFPAKKLPNSSKTLTGWEMGFPPTATQPGLLVNDNNNTINNPDGNYFLWVPGNSYCVLNDPLSLQAGQCIEISVWAAALSNANPQQPTRIKIEIIKLSDNSVIVPYTQVLPASASINNMNWQNIITRFAVPQTGSYKFLVTQEVDTLWGPTAKGMAIDGFYMKECCTTPPTGCQNYTITRIWTARDQTGNTTKQTQVITVQDTQAPTFNNVPANTTVCGAAPAALAVTATDNCDATPSVILLSEVSTKTNNGSCTDNFYTVTRTWKTTDKCGNQATATQVITVLASPIPTITALPFCAGSSTTLSAQISACIPTATYQWQHWNGTTWDNVGTNSATFTTPVLSSNQDYKVVVTIPNSTCSGTSTTYTATPATALAVTVSTPNASVCVNSVPLLTAQVTGGLGSFTYKWQSSLDGNNNWTDIAYATDAVYTLETSSTSNKYYRIVVTANGNGCGFANANGIQVKVENKAGCDCLLQSCSAYTKLVYKNPTQIKDVTGLVGDKWLFKDVATGFDAIVEITKASNANSLNAIDNTAVNVDDWCPEINFNFLAGQDSYMDWKITIVAAGTENPANLPTSSRVTSYDVDGNANYREMHGHINSNGYIVNNPTELNIVNEPPFTLVLGSTNEYTSISTDSKVKATFYYPGQNNVFTIRLGVRTTNAVSAGYRQFAVSFDPCITYTNPNINQQLPEIVGTNAACVSGTHPTYTTTQPFTAYTWTVLGGTIVSGQGTRTITVDWTETGAKSVSVSTVDANGCIGAANFAVTVSQDPSVSLNTNAAVLCQGENMTLTATVTGGAGAPTFQWYSSSNNTTWDKIEGATASTYDVSGSSLGVKYYHVVVLFGNTGCTATSNSTTVETVLALSISTPLVGFTECLGGAKKLQIVTVGGKNTTYQWQTSPNGTDNWANIDGEISNMYTPLSNTIGTKYYRVVVNSESTGCANMASNPVDVVVVEDPTISVSVTATSVCTGGTVVLTANVNDASNSCTIQWQSKTPTGNWTDIQGANSATYTAETLNNTTRYKVGLNCAASGCCN